MRTIALKGNETASKLIDEVIHLVLRQDRNHKTTDIRFYWRQTIASLALMEIPPSTNGFVITTEQLSIQFDWDRQRYYHRGQRTISESS